MAKAYINPQGLFPSQQYGFSQAVSTTGRTTVYLSGQVGWDSKQQIVDSLDLGAQTRRSLENLETTVRAAGDSRTDIVSLRLYIVGDHIRNATTVREALLSFFPPDKLPASNLDWRLCAFLSHLGVVWKSVRSFVVGQSTRQES
jgi:enamine deaminase RidA (YjgF/YER057c/UK114 family)